MTAPGGRARRRADRGGGRCAARAAALAVVLASVPWFAACGDAPSARADPGADARAGDVVVLDGTTMGTSWSVTIAAPPADLERDALAHELGALLDGLDAAMSTWRADSEVLRFSASRSTGWIAVSPATRDVVAEAQAVAALTDGALDVTLGPLVDLWGFGPSAAPFRRPPPDALAAARGNVGARHLFVHPVQPALRKSCAELALDLSAVAKGDAVDRVSAALLDRGLAQHLVEVGGELRARGRGPGGRPWTVAVTAPAPATASAPATAAETVAGVAATAGIAVLRLQDCALATSGDARRRWELDGRRYGHVLDPRTGEPVQHDLASVTVVAATAARADALATALFVLGPQKGPARAEALGVAALFVRHGAGPDRVRVTPALRNRIEP